MSKVIMKEVDLDTQFPVRVEISEYREVVQLNVRHWWKPEGAEDFVRTKKGIIIPVDDTLALVNTILDAYNEAVGSSFQITEGTDDK